MSDEDRIAEAIWRVDYDHNHEVVRYADSWSTLAPDWQKYYRTFAQAAIDALHEPITTVEQLDALPPKCVLRYSYTSQAGWKLHVLWERLEGGWFCIGAPLSPPNQEFGTPLLPALLIWHPSCAAAEADQ